MSLLTVIPRLERPGRVVWRAPARDAGHSRACAAVPGRAGSFRSRRKPAFCTGFTQTGEFVDDLSEQILSTIVI